MKYVYKINGEFLHNVPTLYFDYRPLVIAKF